MPVDTVYLNVFKSSFSSFLFVFLYRKANHRAQYNHLSNWQHLFGGINSKIGEMLLLTKQNRKIDGSEVNHFLMHQEIMSFAGSFSAAENTYSLIQ